MTNEEKINYLNQIIVSNHQTPYGGPNFLYKYRPFDEFTFDMLENEYIFLCPAEKEDDETECKTIIELERLVDLKTNELTNECVNSVLDFIRPYSDENNYEIIKNKILNIINKNGTIPLNFRDDLSIELQESELSNSDVELIVNWIVSIPEMINEHKAIDQLKPLFMTAYNARKEIGICSLTESNDIDYMWDNYAANSTGYCIEYDLSDYELAKNVLPVIYQDKRETNIVIQLVGSFMGQMITGFSNGQIQADSSYFIRLFLTKYKKWKYQKEWRFLGYANEKPKAPRIKTIYLGKNVTAENEKRIRTFAADNNINIENK